MTCVISRDCSCHWQYIHEHATCSTRHRCRRPDPQSPQGLIRYRDPCVVRAGPCRRLVLEATVESVRTGDEENRGPGVLFGSGRSGLGSDFLFQVGLNTVCIYLTYPSLHRNLRHRRTNFSTLYAAFGIPSNDRHAPLNLKCIHPRLSLATERF